jgi:hypothetical protein
MCHTNSIFLCLLFVLLQTGSLATAATRDQEIAECRMGEIATWGDGQDRKVVASTLSFYYRHAGAPSWFAEALVEQAVSRAAEAWSACGIPVRRVNAVVKTSDQREVIVVEWSDIGSRNNFGLADLGRRTLSLGPAAFHLLNARNPRHDATQTLQMTISHEMGHFFGLMAHSRRCVDVLSYYGDGKGNKCYSRDPDWASTRVEYRNVLPTACDIQRCRAANGMPVR